MPRQNGRHFPDDIFKCIFLNENVLISIKISLKFVPNGPINKIPALVQIMAWRRPGDKPLSEPMMVSLPTHICVTRQLIAMDQRHPSQCWLRSIHVTYGVTMPQWVNSSPRTAAYMRQLIGSALVQIMTYRHQASGKNFSEILIKIYNFSFTKMHLQMSFAKLRPFCPGGDELMGVPLCL